MAILRRFLNDTKELIDFTDKACMVTQYKNKDFNRRHYRVQINAIERQLNSTDILAMVFIKATDNYFDNDDLSMKEAINASIEDIKKETGQDPRELVLKAIRKEVWYGRNN